MSTGGMIGMVLCIFAGFVCMVVAAGGWRAGWRTPVWVAWVVAAFLLLTFIPLVMALTIGLAHGT